MSRTRKGGALILCVGLGVGLYFALVAGAWWREEVRVHRVISDTLENNPGRTVNEASIEKAIEEGFPSTDDIQRSPVGRDDDRGDQPTPGLAKGDSEWESYPRTEFQLYSKAPFELVASDLFRNTTLNGWDSYIEPNTRAAFASRLAESVKRVGGLHDTLLRVSRQEFDWMVDRGTAHTIQYSDYLAGLSADERARIEEDARNKRSELEARGFTPEVIDATMNATITFEPKKLVGNAFAHGSRSTSMSIFWAELREMPQSSEAANAYFSSASALYWQVLEFFGEHGGIGENETAAIAEGVQRRLARYLGN